MHAIKKCLLILFGTPIFFSWTSCGQQVSTSDAKVFIGATIFNGQEASLINDGVLVLREGRIEMLGPRSHVPIPKDARLFDVSGRFIIPGLINCHGHVGDTRGLESGHYSEGNILAQLKLYARYGITTVNSLGGDGLEAVAVRDAQTSSDLDRARLLFAGAVVEGESAETVRTVVDRNAEMKVDFIKFRVDDFLGTQPKMPMPICDAIIDRAHEGNLPAVAHLYYLDDAKALVKGGVDFIAHSVRDREVDDELIQLLRAKDISYCPTLTREVSVFVYENEPDFFSDPFFLREVDQEILKQLKAPERQDRIKNSASAQGYKQALAVASSNLKKIADAGITIAFGTDSGPPARFQGYFEHLEMELMAKAGLTSLQILRSATGDAARALGLTDVGTLETGKWADFIVLTKDPFDNIRNTRAIESVWIAGNRVPGKDQS